MAGESELIFYHTPPSRSGIVRWMLEEIGCPYEVRLVGKGATREPAYIAVNPMGKVPAIVHQGVVITEAAAICCYLADTFADAGLAVPVGDARRGPYLKWLFFGPSCFEPAVIDRMCERPAAPPAALGWGDLDTVLDVMAAALEPGPYLLGERFTAADVVIGSGIRWAMMTGNLPERPQFAAYAERLAERPALKRAMELDRPLMGSGTAG